MQINKMIKVYGIKNCDTIKKSLNWLDSKQIEYQFHDYKKLGIDEATLKEFIKKFGLEKVLNSKGITYKKLSESERPKNEKDAIALMIKQTSIIKRPIIQGQGVDLIGFDEGEYKIKFKK